MDCTRRVRHESVDAAKTIRTSRKATNVLACDRLLRPVVSLLLEGRESGGQAAGSPHGDLIGKPMAASETGRLGSHDLPFRREVRPHGGAQPSRGHWKEAFGWNSEPGQNLGSGQGRIKELRPRDAVSDQRRPRSPEKPRLSLRSSGASASGETGFVPDQSELRLQARWNHRGKVGDCRGPDWSDIVTSEQTPRGRDFGQASSGFCASRNHNSASSLHRLALLSTPIVMCMDSVPGCPPLVGGQRAERVRRGRGLASLMRLGPVVGKSALWSESLEGPECVVGRTRVVPPS